MKVTQALHISLDDLVFETDERWPSDKFKLLFEATERLSEKEQGIIQELLEGMIIKYEVRRLTQTS